MAPQNPLPIYGNEKTMNLNSLILTNIQSSPYFKVNLFELKTYHEVIDEIYYKVSHLEPWEKGSRKTAGQTGMCGGVRGVGAGGIVSSAFCLLYKLFTLKLTRKQVNGLLTHADSPYIRSLGFMYIRYTQPPADLWDWYKDYLEDEEEIDVKAGGGHTMLIGEMLKQWLVKLEWYSTLFPRIPVPIQKKLEAHLKEYEAQQRLEQGEPDPASLPPATAAAAATATVTCPDQENMPDVIPSFGEAARIAQLRESPSRPGSSPHADRTRPRDRRPSPPFDIAKEIQREKERQSHPRKSRSRERDAHRRSRSRDRDLRRRSRSRDRDRERRRSQERNRDRRRSKSRDRHNRDRERKRSRSKERRRSRSRDRKRRSKSRDRSHKHRRRSKSPKRGGHRESSFERDLKRERSRIEKSRYKDD